MYYLFKLKRFVVICSETSKSSGKKIKKQFLTFIMLLEQEINVFDCKKHVFRISCQKFISHFIGFFLRFILYLSTSHNI